MHSALFNTRGNGWEGSIVTGVSSGSTSSSKKRQRIGPRRLAQVLPLQYVDVLRSHRRQQLFVPALILRLDELLHLLAQQVKTLLRPQPPFVRRLRFVVAILDPLQETRHPYLDELIQIAGRNRQKLHPLE